MPRFSNVVNYNSPDGLPSRPWPGKVVPTTCPECYNKVTEQVCPHCGADVELEMEIDYDCNYDEFDHE